MKVNIETHAGRKIAYYGVGDWMRQDQQTVLVFPPSAMLPDDIDQEETVNGQVTAAIDSRSLTGETLYEQYAVDRRELDDVRVIPSHQHTRLFDLENPGKNELSEATN